MLRFHAVPFASTMAALERCISVFVLAQGYPTGLEDLQRAIAAMGTELQRLPVSQVITSQYERMRERADEVSEDDWLLMQTLVIEFENNLREELTAHYFLMIPADRRELYEQRKPPMSALVEAAFPEAKYDIEAAHRCLALDEWTAAVFHLMRVLEHGLRDMAKRLNIEMLASLDYENWKNIIDQIEAAIRDIERLPKSPEKIETLRFFSDAASAFRHFKDAWRNDIAHTRSIYDERQAFNIWGHVRSFMQGLASDGVVGP